MLGKLILDCAEALGQSLDLRQSLCTPMRYSRSGCRACVDACRVNALSFNGKQWRIAAACDACGACAGACPTGAIDLRDQPAAAIESQIRKKLAATPAAEIVFTCEKVPATLQRGIIVPCAARLDESLLVGSALQGASRVTVAVGDCRTCPRASRFNAVFDDTLRFARAVLLSLGLDPAIVRLGKGEAAPPVKTARSASGAGRRDFFRQLMGSVAKAGAGKQAPTMVTAAPGKGRRNRLVEAIRASGRTFSPVAADHLPLGWISILADACWGCTTCQHVCPPGALTRKLSPEGAATILFDAALCTACGACVAACMPQAMQLEPSGDLSPLGVLAQRELVRLPPRVCVTCRQSFFSSDADRCPGCRKRAHPPAARMA